MPLTRDFRETVMARVKSDPAFRGELIVEATNAFLMDDMETGKALLRDYLNATESIADIARELQVNEKSLRRMRLSEDSRENLQCGVSAGCKCNQEDCDP
jgi:hypothetical protein